MTLRQLYRTYRSDGRNPATSATLTYVVMPVLSAVTLGSLMVGVGALFVVSKLAAALPPRTDSSSWPGLPELS